MSTSPTPVRATPLRTMRRSAPIPRQLLPALLSVLAGCVTISDDEYAWRLKEGTTDGGDDGGDDGDGEGCPGGGEEQVFYTDADADGFGDPQGAVWACEQPDGTAVNADDCDDEDPGAALLAEFWLDGDSDGVGGDVSVTDCTAPEGYTTTTGDCDDANATVSPLAPEICDGRDNDCDELADDDDPDVDLSEEPMQYPDADDDGYGDTDGGFVACELASGHVLQDGDCDDGELYANPGLDEICNDGIDNNCDGVPNDCVMPAEVDLAAADVTFTTVHSYVSHGEQVLAAGDVDGDGVADLAVSAPGESAVGAVYLVDGLGALSGQNGTQDVATARLTPGAQGGRLGHALASMGDLDGDGLDDLLIGDPYDDTQGSLAGAAWLVTGPISGDVAVDTVGVALLGESASAYAGWSVASGGDVDSDGEIDLLVGAYRDGSVAPQAGAAYLVHGPVTADTSLADADWVVQGSWQDRVGYALAGNADLDGDGVADIVVGSDRSDPGGLSNAGTVAVFYGPVSGTAVLDDADVLRTGASGSAYLGYALASGGDLDGDGLHDLVMGAPGEGTGAVGGPGAVFVEHGPVTGTSDVSASDAWINGMGSTDTLGTALAIVPDLDGDGDDELLVGAPGTVGGSGLDDGAALMWMSPLVGGLDTSSADVTLSGPSDGRAGSSVAGSTDLAGDGLPDLLIGSPSVNQAHVVFGRGL